MIENASLNEDVDLSNYYTKDEINNKGFISSIPSEYVTDSELKKAISYKQDRLVSGQNIKTINGQDILGEGNIEIVSEVDLTNYYTKEEIESKNYITEDDIKTLVVDGEETEFKNDTNTI